MTAGPRWLFGGAVLVLGVGVAVWLAFRRDGGPVEVRVPELSASARAGAEVFARRCALCHGSQAQGSPKGPPLVHAVYRPAHHADAAFELAVRRGVRAHHWRFGDMPAQPDVPPDELLQTTRYVRELQRANGVR